jgi:hypothetical protein
MYRQGDVFIKAATIPVDAKPVKAVNRRYVLAEGEVTGHAHALAATKGVEMYERDGTLYLRITANKGAELKHEEHAPILLPIGDYVVRKQREYTPEAIRYVVD